MTELPEELKAGEEWGYCYQGFKIPTSVVNEWLEKYEVLKALAFVEHLKNHPEVQSAPLNAGVPMCKICDKTIDEIYIKQEKGVVRRVK